MSEKLSQLALAQTGLAPKNLDFMGWVGVTGHVDKSNRRPCASLSQALVRLPWAGLKNFLRWRGGVA